MMASYWWRLAWLALACFFVVHLAAGIAVRLFALRAVRFAERFRPRSAAQILFFIRLLPLTLAMLAVAAVCVPSYLWLEPWDAQEQVGWLCLTAGACAILLIALSAGRLVVTSARSHRYMQRWRLEGRVERLGDAGAPAWVIPSDVPFLALAGIMKPRLIASRGLLRTLSSAQLTAALRHEQAHLTSRDNLKRLIIQCAPPFSFDLIEQAWARFAERAADDRAAGEDPGRALLLAEALVRVARIQGPQSALVAPLIADGSELHARVDRLLRLAPAPDLNWHRYPLAFAGFALVTAILVEPLLLRVAHRLLEHLIH